MDDANDVRDDAWLTELLGALGVDDFEVGEPFFQSLEAKLDEAQLPSRGRVDELLADAVVELLNLGGSSLSSADGEEE